ncbi:MAG: phosphatidate cytidylyltransferase, partial [Pseudomonadota bacterium]
EMTFPGKFADLRARVITSLFLIVVVFGTIWAGGLLAALMVTFASGWMAVELAAITQAHEGKPDMVKASIWALPAVGLMAAFLFLSIPEAQLTIAALIALIGLIDMLARRVPGLMVRVIGVAWVVGAGLAFLWIRNFPEWGLLTAIWVALVVAASDTGAYFAGRLIGGPKLWPAVSPSKTWAGLGGGVVFAFLVGGVFSWATTGTTYPQVCTVSAVAALLAQAGDLAESALKRRYRVKDAGGLLPGHGGLLDRCDGLLAASLVAALVMSWRGQTVFIW